MSRYRFFLHVAVLSVIFFGAAQAGTTYYLCLRGEYYDDEYARCRADMVTTQIGQTTSGIDFSLKSGSGAIAGRVTAEDTGNPLEGVMIIVNAEISSDFGAFTLTSYTDNDGRYRIDGLVPFHSYHVAAFPYSAELNYQYRYYDGALNWAGADDIEVFTGQTTEGIDLELPVGGIVRGQVVRMDNGDPLEDVSVIVYQPNDAYSINTSTGAGGIYEIKGMKPGNCMAWINDSEWELMNLYYNQKLSYSTADTFTVSRGHSPPQPQTHIDFDVPPGGSISGRVRHTGNWSVCEGLYVMAYDQDTQYYRFDYTAPDGRYHIHGLPTGNYMVTVGEIGIVRQDVPVTAPNETLNINFDFCQLSAGVGEIHGRVTSQGSGEGIEGLEVHAYSVTSGFERHVCTDADGFYELCDLYEDDYDIRVLAPGRQWVAEYHPGVVEYDQAVPVDVQADSVVSGIDFQLVTGGLITGTVYHEFTGEPVPGCMITLDYGSDTPLQTGLETTDIAGNYTCRYLDSGGLPARDYYVHTGYHSIAIDTENTPTPAPTSDPGTTPTPGPSPSPTPEGIAVKLNLSEDTFEAGDIFHLEAVLVNNSMDTLTGYPLVVLLDVYGEYFWAPSWSKALDYYDLTVSPGTAGLDILNFEWPQVTGHASDLYFYGALLDSGFSAIVGEWDAEVFGW